MIARPLFTEAAEAVTLTVPSGSGRVAARAARVAEVQVCGWVGERRVAGEAAE